MKLLLIWLVGVPLAVGAMCTAAALASRGNAAPSARQRVADRPPTTSSTRIVETDAQRVLATVGQ